MATKVPTRQLGAVIATSTDSLGAVVALRALSNGDVLVNDVQRHRVLLFDKTLKTAKVVLVALCRRQLSVDAGARCIGKGGARDGTAAPA